MKKENAKLICRISLFLLLILSFGFNLSKYTAEYVNDNFDSWSNGIMVADLNYRQNYTVRSSFLKVITPGAIVNGGTLIKSGDDVLQTYLNNEKYLESDYGDYQSNICWHKYLYRLIDKYLSVSNRNTIQIIHVFNVITFVVLLFYILLWFEKRSNLFTLTMITIVLALFSPNLAMYPKNLYWIAWSLFLPMAASIYIVNRNEKKGDIANKTMFLVALATCFIKQLFYFEFISTVIISLIVPYLFFFVYNEYKYKRIIKKLTFPFWGGVTSFLIISFIKLSLFVRDGTSFGEAVSCYVNPMVYRLIGVHGSQNALLNESGNISLARVLKIMLQKPAISIRNTLFLSQFALIVILLILTLLLLSEKNKNLAVNSVNEVWNQEIKNKKAWVLSLWFGLLGPFSWFIAAKPHTYVHNEHCSITWYISFTILLIMYFLYTISGSINSIVKYIYNLRKRKLFKRISLSIAAAIVLMMVVKQGYNYLAMKKEMSRVIENGRNLYQKEQSIYIYDNALYYIARKGKDTKERYFLHIYYDDNSEQFENLDFDFKTQEIYKIPFVRNKIAKVQIDNYKLISWLSTGQFNAETELKTWQSDVVINDKPETIKKVKVSLICDENWNYGLRNDKATILVEGEKREYLGLVGKSIVLNNGDEYEIDKVEFPGNNYTHIILKRPITNSEQFFNNAVSELELDIK